MDQFNFSDFPNTNFNEINLDWIAQMIQQLTELVESGRYGVPTGGETGQVLGKLSDSDFDTGWIDQTGGGGGGGGTTNYNQLSNRPAINGHTLTGNQTAAQLGLAAATDIPAVPVQSVNGKTGAVVLDAADVGALPSDTVIPSKTSELQNDSGYLTLATLPIYNGGVI